MKLNVAAKIAIGFVLTLVILAVVGAASFEAASALVRASQWRRHSVNVLDHLNQTVPLLKEVELGSRSYFLTDNPSFLEQARTASNKLSPLLRQIRTLTADNPRQQQRLDVLEPLVKRRLQHVMDGLDVYRTQGQKSVAQWVKGGEGVAMTAEIVRVVGEMHADERSLLKQRSAEADEKADGAKRTIVLGTLAALVLAVVAGYLITRDIARPLHQLSAVAEQIAIGDIRVKVPATDRSDEVGMLARAFQRMTVYLLGMAQTAEHMAAGDLRSPVTPQAENDLLGNAFQRMSTDLREQIRGLVEAISVLGVSASQIVASTSELAASATQSAAAVAQTTATAEEVRQTAELAAQKAKHVSDTAQRAAKDTESGLKSGEDAVAATARIRQQMEDIATHMGRLAEHGQAIGQIIASVEDLAVQSNLLAVNAAIEAAKAGEHGKGFGVVAQEVKSLATQSRQATAEVRTLLGEIQAATAAAVVAMQKGGQAAESGKRESDTARQAIEALAGSIREAAQAATQIATSSHQQLVGVDQVAGAMESIRLASTQNTASARDLEGASRKLNELGQQLQQIVARYRF